MPERGTAVYCMQLWDGTGSPPIQDAALLIEGQRIAAVGPREKLRVGEGWHVVDLPQATLLPGFVDMHIHLANDGWTPLRLLTSGITTVRDTGNRTPALLTLRERQKQRDWTGPRIFSYGPLIDGEKPFWPHVARGIADEEETEAVVCELIHMGVDGLKTYVHAPPGVVRRVVEEAHRHGKKVTCHCGATRASEALSYGMDCVEHVFCLDVLEPDQGWADLDVRSERMRSLLGQFRETGAWFTPTLAVLHGVQHCWGPRFQQFDGYHDYPDYLRNWFRDVLAHGAESYSWDEARVALAEAGFRRMQEVPRAFYEAGVPQLAGSDSPFVPVGHGFHYELELLSEGNVPNDYVLAMATRLGAEFLGQSDRFGTLEAGKIADIVGVRGDPLQEIRSTRNVEAVWLEGRQLDLAAMRSQADEIIRNAPAHLAEGIPPYGLYEDPC
jgi:imidazolonepropionase-like amidohydrolase